MTTLQYFAAAAGAVIVLWPALYKAAGWAADRLTSVSGGDVPALPVKQAGPTFEQSVANLAKVRSRLIDTSLLADNEKKAIDVLTLALVAGSDK